MTETQEEYRKLAEKKANKAARGPVLVVDFIAFAIFMTMAILWSPDIFENWVLLVVIGILVSAACSGATWKIIHNKYYPIYLQRLQGEKNEM